MAQDDLLPTLGFPKGLEFNCKKKKEVIEEGKLCDKKDKPNWCFLQIMPKQLLANGSQSKAKPKRLFCISMDGVTVNTRKMKRVQAITEMVYAKR